MPYRTIVNFLNGAVRTATEVYEDVTETVRAATPEPLGRALDFIGAKVEQAVSKTPIGVAERGAAATGEMISESTGNQVLGGAVGFGLGLAAGGPAVGGAAKRIIPKGLPKPKPTTTPVNMTMPPGMVPAMAGGAPMPVAPLQPSFERGGIVLKAVTARDPESLKLAGVKTGQDIVSIDEAKQLTKRSLKVQTHLDKIDSLEIKLIEALDLGADDYTIKRLRANLKKERPKLYSARSNVSVPTKEDPLYYGSAEARRERDALALSKGTTEALEEHHLFPKVVSAAFFGKMDELIKKGKAELDDLLLMNRVAIAKGRKPGDYKSGMYLLEKAPHNEYHTIMKEAGDEFKLNQAES